MSFPSNTYRGEPVEQIEGMVDDLVRRLDRAMLIPDKAQRRAAIHALFDGASHNQRAVLTEAAIELLVLYYPTARRPA